MVALLTVLTTSFTLFFASHQVLANPSLLGRQSSPIDPSRIPTQCKSTCESVVNAMTGCSSQLSCLCTDSNMSGLAACFTCAAGVKETGLEPATVQSILDQFADGCNSAGIPVKQNSVGSSNDSGSSSSKGTGSSTSTGANPPANTDTGSSKDNSAAQIGARNGGMLAAVALGATLLLA